MKRLFLFAAVTAVALSSCSKDEVTSTSMDNQAIGFGIYTGVTTKGTEVTTATLGASGGVGFGVLGYYHQSTSTTTAAWANSSTPNFMYNEQVKGDGGDPVTWSYSPLKYWPNNTVDRVSFFAYAPYTEQTAATDGIELSGNTSEGIPTLDYTVTADNIVDLVVAKPLYNLDKSNYGTQVAFTFQHVLTRLNFSAWANVDASSLSTGAQPASETHVYVTDLQIVGSGNETLKDKTNTTNTTAQRSSEYFSTAQFTFANSTNAATTAGTWGQAATAISANTALSGLLDKSNAALTYGTSGSSTLLTANSCVDVTSGTKTAPITLLAAPSSVQNYVFMLPPNGTTGLAADGGVKIYVEYKIITEDSNLVTEHSTIINQDIVSLPAGLLAQGVAYNINLELGLTEVKVSATVSDWDTETSNTEVATPDTATATTTVTASSADAAALATAVTTLNDYATSGTTAYYVNVSASLSGTVAIDLTDITEFNFNADDTITFTFASDANVGDLTFTNVPSGYTITNDPTYSSGTSITFKVGASA